MKFSNYKIVPKTEIGQHFLTNNKVLELVVKQIPLKSKVLEIGAGPGQLTEKLAESVKCVEAVEIDRQFLPLLEAIKKKQSQVNIIIGDALDLDFKKYADFWIAGNLPYHITEPLLAKIINLPIKGAVFLVGQSFGQEATALINKAEHFGKLSLLVFTFFEAKVLARVKKEDFDPKPRTDSLLIVLVPRKESEYKDRLLFLLRWLILGARKSALIKNSLREGLIKYQKITKNEARDLIADLKLPNGLLEKPFEQLNNHEYLLLYKALVGE
ncbi:hypothetical protein COS31_00365 [Candidatus Roizmanbacteria bacterium CG02_land_8_20_14_3_00_36_15]|uniref:Ribosomal RNA adenine methylase transferase N-terminal domain-containing protein n=3 Tax=Microgenomates group TaxID=1794810 RepID=A0A1J5AZI1_9BACT|nr:MAG: hypothetical protein AUK18_00975 [Candidatus Beckwithbacteria bacterium CG2_30_44_31]PIP14881.1 MAG: hypothetical protein COX47_02720 [Candidatus Roizmanbacteria bacterium CG23_combo_of_CG06-09_8_20_14_all_35_49]PIV09957.1 MAG: hypothetical protein COS51_00370 [Candidatus Roizmanbacteria bacterium CG03_land_8_20_14_0_80_36_21]PIV38255.1 MAG: hypothetical protein COS31_00365 [Candidatus Roizmanbacteria bacterium CG02_land_8_20_14_3_00_36_15]PJA53330.1 MAG: hypothetical protein CO166_0223